LYYLFTYVNYYKRPLVNTAWLKKMDLISYVYISWTIHGMWMIYITFERGGPKFSNTTARALAYRTAVQQRQLRTKLLLCSVGEFIKTESATAVQRAFRLPFNIKPPTRKSICRWNHQLEQIGCLCPSFWITLYFNQHLK
jgi:hypothetical protein